MTMMNGLDRRELDILDEDYFGPPPRFLRESRPLDYRSELEEELEAHDATLPTLKRIKSLLGIC
jgi:hypothetical protein